MDPLHYSRHQQPTPLPSASWYVGGGVRGRYSALVVHAVTCLEYGMLNLIPSSILALVLAVVIVAFLWP